MSGSLSTASRWPWEAGILTNGEAIRREVPVGHGFRRAGPSVHSYLLATEPTGQAEPSAESMEPSTVAPETTERANELYWSSGRSVNQIADDLDLSKGALYALIEPLEAGLACPLCGAEVVYSNRTAKERGLVDCLRCDWDGNLGETESVEGIGDEPDGSRASPIYDRDVRLRTMAGGALLGAAAGLALVMWARRR